MKIGQWGQNFADLSNMHYFNKCLDYLSGFIVMVSTFAGSIYIVRLIWGIIFGENSLEKEFPFMVTLVLGCAVAFYSLERMTEIDRRDNK